MIAPMAFDSSLDFFAAAALFTAAIGAWALAAPLSLRARLYLRFAAVLFSALALSVPLGMADTAALFLLPLAAAALMVSALARFTRPLSVLLASLALVAALAGGLGALISGTAMPALVPVIFAGLAVIASALNGIAVMPVLAGASLLAGAMAFLEQGAKAGVFLFSAAALIGLVRPSALAVQQQRHAGRGRAAVSGLDADAFASFGHRLAKHLGNESRQQSRRVPKRVEARGVIAGHKFDLERRRRFFSFAAGVRVVAAQGAGSAGFFDRTQRCCRGFGGLRRCLSEGVRSRA